MKSTYHLKISFVQFWMKEMVCIYKVLKVKHGSRICFCKKKCAYFHIWPIGYFFGESSCCANRDLTNHIKFDHPDIIYPKSVTIVRFSVGPIGLLIYVWTKKLQTNAISGQDLFCKMKIYLVFTITSFTITIKVGHYFRIMTPWLELRN